jgi:hypothetical protein
MTTVACERCGFQVALDLQEGTLSAASLDQSEMKRLCKRASDPEFAFDCLDLTSAVLMALEHEPRPSQADPQ